jgi:hypothetical protein
MIQPIVEGHGEVEAVPVLLRRLAAEAGGFDVQVATPRREVREGRSFNPDEFAMALEGLDEVVRVEEGAL